MCGRAACGALVRGVSHMRGGGESCLVTCAPRTDAALLLLLEVLHALPQGQLACGATRQLLDEDWLGLPKRLALAVDWQRASGGAIQCSVAATKE